MIIDRGNDFLDSRQFNDYSDKLFFCVLEKADLFRFAFFIF